MKTIHKGQCGLCSYFGEHNPKDQKTIQKIHQQKQGPEDLVEPCEHPKFTGSHLTVTPISGCDGFKQA
ncbi:MAG: hypothetical protein FWC56_03165 [Phycisphaerae bacterium]|nr:hypothetical protein [Phycisphaerae bacterium]